MKPQNVLFCCVMPITFVCSFVTLLGSFAQQAPDVRVGGIRRFGDLLREHNIELTEPALLGALKNPDSEVRFLAAMKLAEDKAIDAIPAVKRALAVEKIARTRVNIAVALGLLGDPAGHDELKKVCDDENVPPELCLYAVRYMFDLHFQKDEDCLGAAEEIVESKNTDFSNQIAALELLPMFQNLTARESQDALRNL